jgi:hypothetical protein
MVSLTMISILVALSHCHAKGRLKYCKSMTGEEERRLWWSMLSFWMFLFWEVMIFVNIFVVFWYKNFYLFSVILFTFVFIFGCFNLLSFYLVIFVMIFWYYRLVIIFAAIFLSLMVINFRCSRHEESGPADLLSNREGEQEEKL